jgi:HSP20 family protein
MNLRSLIPIGRERGLTPRNGNPFMSLQREVDRLFEDFGRGFPSFGSLAPSAAGEMMPVMDVRETDKEFEFTVELPGLEEKDVQINIADDVLTIRGEKKTEKEEKEGDYKLIERSYGSFYRNFELPHGIEADKIQASLAKGVLKVTVPKPAPSQMKKIAVKSAA